jgi:NAD(P)-dependent dehydrogenase (short-subunit alcohol dehydrogenase family)
MATFTQKTVLVTGAASGIGRETAQQFATEGANVVVADIDDEGASETVGICEDVGGTAMAIQADVTEMTAVESMVQTTVETYGRLDYAVNNAGVGGEATALDHTEASWMRVIDTNLNGVWRCLRHEIEQMRSQDDGGVIINVASTLGLVGTERAAGYIAAKHGVTGLTKAAAIDYADEEIRVNAVCPGYINTPMSQQDRSENRIQELGDRHALGRFGETAEVADAILWLCSEGASFVTGETLAVDGGYASR